MFKKIVIVTRRTRLQELVERFNTHSQAKFYIEHSGGDFADYEREDDSYQTALDLVRRSLDFELPHQVVDRALIPTYKFQKEDVVVTLGQDGLVANTAKYAGAQPIVAINPEPSRFDGILLPFLPDQARTAVGQVLDAKAAFREVTLADATLNDGQRLLAFNDLFLGARSHVSALYRIVCGVSAPETQSSKRRSGFDRRRFHRLDFLCLQHGFGCDEFLRRATGQGHSHALGRSASVIRRSGAVYQPPLAEAGIVAGMLETGEELVLESLMPSGGAIFSDGMEADFLQFNSGAIVRVRAAEQRARLVVS